MSTRSNAIKRHNIATSLFHYNVFYTLLLLACTNIIKIHRRFIKKFRCCWCCWMCSIRMKERKKDESIDFRRKELGNDVHHNLHFCFFFSRFLWLFFYSSFPSLPKQSVYVSFRWWWRNGCYPRQSRQPTTHTKSFSVLPSCGKTFSFLFRHYADDYFIAFLYIIRILIANRYDRSDSFQSFGFRLFCMHGVWTKVQIKSHRFLVWFGEPKIEIVQRKPNDEKKNQMNDIKQRDEW